MTEHWQEECSVSSQVLNVFLVKQHFVTTVLECLKTNDCSMMGTFVSILILDIFQLVFALCMGWQWTWSLQKTRNKKNLTDEEPCLNSESALEHVANIPATPEHPGSQVESVHGHQQWGFIVGNTKVQTECLPRAPLTCHQMPYLKGLIGHRTKFFRNFLQGYWPEIDHDRKI